jgi:hypothetical protein
MFTTALRKLSVVALVACALAGCHVELLRDHPLGCRSDEQAMVRDMLYFGTSIPHGGGDVDDSRWQRFAQEVITPAFPKGFTELAARGTWRSADGSIDTEASHVVVIVHADDHASAAALRAITQRYRDMFHQESVLRERSAVCAQF